MARSRKSIELEIEKVKADIAEDAAKIEAAKVELAGIANVDSVEYSEYRIKSKDIAKHRRALRNQIEDLEADKSALEVRLEQLDGYIFGFDARAAVKKYQRDVKRIYVLAHQQNKRVYEVDRLRREIKEIASQAYIPSEFRDTPFARENPYKMPTMSNDIGTKRLTEMRQGSLLIVLPEIAADVVKA